jgi:ferric-dicitrate binding protein FerR (iron transport regulator)
MRLSNQDDLQIAEEAAAWVVRLKREETHTVRAEFDEWCRSPRHLREYLRARATDRRLDVLARMPLESRRSKASNVLLFRPRNAARVATGRSTIAALFARVRDWIRARTGRSR